MFRDVTFGQYYPVESFIHKMDARIKIILSVLYLVGIFFLSSFFQFGIIFLFLIIIVIASKVPIRSVIKSIKPILVLIVFTVVLNLFFVNEGDVLLKWWIFRITYGGLISAGRMLLRLIMLVMGASILTLTTTPVELTHAIESLLKPLRIIKFPVHEFALIMSIALKFIPSLMDETDRIIRAQSARGASFDTGSLFARTKAFIPILIPLLVSSFRRAEELAWAMDSRCYNGGVGRTKMKIMRTTWRDFLGLFIMLLFIGAIVVLKVFEPQLIDMFGFMYV